MNHKKAALFAAFPHTIPVMTGYLVLGAAYGILMNSKGISLLWVLLSSIFIYAGSMQFVAVALLSAGFHPLNTFFMTLMVNARHLFYGISMLGKYRGMGKFKPYLIFSLTDESFSILCSTEPPEGIERRLFMFYVSLLDQIYWITGSVVGAVLGSLIQFNTNGIDFVLTALFVVILVNQWQQTTNHLPVITGILCGILCLIIFGPDHFLLPTMISIILIVTLLKKPMQRGTIQ